MKRKWSYAAAMMLALAGSMLTGCIDNDEPQGILAVRQSLSNLLDAKAAALEAEKAANEAQLAIEKIKAEAEAAKLQAEAAKTEAEAEIAKLQAQADAAQTEAETAQFEAEIERYKAETEVIIAEKKAALEEQIALAEINVKTSQLAYDEALYTFEKQKSENADAASHKLYLAYEKAFDVYLSKLQAYNEANEQLLLAQRMYALAEIDLQWDKDNGKWISPKYNDIQVLYDTREEIANKIATQNEEIAGYKELIADLQNITTTDLYEVYEKYVDLEDQALVDLGTAVADLATVQADNKELYDKKDANEAALADLTFEEHTIAAYTYPGSTLISLPAYKEEYPIVGKNTTWTWDDKTNYENAVKDYQRFINSLTSSLLDENDIAWTNARLQELNRQLTADTEEFNKLKAAWELAKKGYNNGGVADGSVYPNADEVAAAVKKYNDEEANVLVLSEAYQKAMEAVTEAQDALNKAGEEYNGTNDENGTSNLDGTSPEQVYRRTLAELNAAEEAAEEEYNAAEEAAAKVQLTANTTAWNTFVKARDDYNALIAEIDALQIQVDAGDTTAQKALEAAKAKVEAASKTANDAYAVYQTALSKNATTYNKAVAAANTKYVQTMNDINAKKAAALATYNLAIIDDKAAVAVVAAQEALEAAEEKRGKAWQAVFDEIETLWGLNYEAYDAIMKQETAMNDPEISFYCDPFVYGLPGYAAVRSYIQTLAYGIPEEIADAEFPAATVPAEYVVDGVYVYAQVYLVRTSDAAFGAMSDYDIDKGYPELNDEAMLVDEVTVDMVNNYIKNYWGVDEQTGENNIKPWDYYTKYYMFGAYGEVLLLQDRIAVATAMLGNNDLIDEILKDPEANLAALKAEYASVKDAIEANADEGAEIKSQINAIVKDAEEKKSQAEKWYGLYKGMVADLEYAVALVEEELDLGDETLDEYLEHTITDYEGLIETCEESITEQEKLQKENDYQISLLEANEDTILANPYTLDVTMAQNAVDEAKEALEYWSDKVDDRKAAYEASVSE